MKRKYDMKDIIIIGVIMFTVLIILSTMAGL